MSTLFGGVEHAKMYTIYRPRYPPQIYEKIFEYLDECGSPQQQQQQQQDGKQPKRRNFALDVGCGSGQNTRLLAEHFERVTGVDTSEAQLEEAKTACSSYSNITYRQGAGEDMGFLSDGSVDLVTAATALHWFEFERFFSECRRVLRPDGVAAAFSYGEPVLEKEEADCLYKKLSCETLGEYRAPPTLHVSNRYQDVFAVMAKVFPTSKRDDSVVLSLKQTIGQLCGWIQSVSFYQSYRKQNPHLPDPLVDFAEQLKLIYGTQSEDDQVIDLHFDIFLILGKKH